MARFLSDQRRLGAHGGLRRVLANLTFLRPQLAGQCDSYENEASKPPVRLFATNIG